MKPLLKPKEDTQKSVISLAMKVKISCFFLFFLQNESSDKVYVHFQCRFGHELEFLNHLVADQVPFLFIVILSEEPGFVWRQVHRILKI